jgi:hypothetical protein
MENGTANDRVAQYTYDGRHQAEEYNIRKQMTFALLNSPGSREELESAYQRMFNRSIMEK